MPKTRVLKIVWLSLASLVTIPLLATYNTTTNRDNPIVLAYLLMILTFPTGIAVAAVLALLGYGIESSFRSPLLDSPFGMVVTSIGFLLAGYLQWFVAIPALLKLLKTRKPSTHGS